MKKTMKKAVSMLMALGMLGSMCGTISADNGSEYPEYLNMDGTRRIVKEGYDVELNIMVCRTLGAKGDINENWFPQFIEQELGVKLNIEEVTYDVGAEKKQLQLASGDLPDINFYLGLNANAQAQYGMEEEILLPISDYFSEELTPNIMALLESNPLIKENYEMPNGKMYTIPWGVAQDIPGSGRQSANEQFLFVNMDYMEAIGRTKDDMPKTLDEFIEMLREIKALDPATMGVDEIIPFVGADTCEEVSFNPTFGWALSYGGSWLKPAWDVQAHDVVIPALTDKYYDFVDFYRTMYSEGLIHKDWYTLDADSARALVTAGKAAVYSDYGPSDYVSAGTGEAWFINNLASEYNDNQGFTVVGTGISGNHVFCDSDTEYPEVIVRLFDYFMSPEGSVYAQYGPPAGSPDCLGIVEGYTLDEETGRIKTPDPVAPAESYNRDMITLAQCTPINSNYHLTYAYELLGAEAPVDPEYGMLIPGQPNLSYEKYKATIENDISFVDPTPTAIMDPDTATELADMYTLLEDHRAAEVAKFVTGVRPMEEWEDFKAELEDLGASEYQAMYDEAYANYTREGR